MRLLAVTLLSALITFGCTKVHKVKDTTSLKLEIIEDEVIYHDDDTLRLNLKLTNDGACTATIASLRSLFTLVSVPVHSEFVLSRTFWFAGIENDEGFNGHLQTFNPGDSRIVPVGFVSLMSTADYPELNLIALYHVTVEIDTMSTEYEIWSRDSVRIITEK